MIQFRWCVFGAALGLMSCGHVLGAAVPGKPDANRLAYLGEENPFYPHLGFARLTTPQWVGEPAVQTVVILAIDDMREHAKYETMLRPILDRLKQIDGRAPVSIMCNTIDPQQPHLQQWLQEGVSLEVHTLAHPCPLLGKAGFAAAAATYHDCAALLHSVPGNQPVAFRMPCCDSMSSASPRFYTEIFNRPHPDGSFLTIDTSVMQVFTADDPALPRECVVDPDGKDKFRKYTAFPGFATTIENYPYPYVLGGLCWEFPGMAPSDWEAQHLQGTNNPATVADWKAALDAAVVKQGTFTFVFHPHGWIRSDQMVEFIDYAVERHGNAVKFLNFREAAERLNRHLLGGHPLRSPSGGDNGVRVLDLNADGYLDVIIGNDQARVTRIWSPSDGRWLETSFPTVLVTRTATGQTADAGVRFGIIETNGFASMLVNDGTRGAWRFDGQRWVEAKALWTGLEWDGQPLRTRRNGADTGFRLRDVNQDGRCEVVIGNPDQNAVFAWSPNEETWTRLPYGLPPGATVVDAGGNDAGLRFVDINEDGFDDVVFSNAERYSVHLFMEKFFLGFQAGWTREVMSGRRDDVGALPMIVRGSPPRSNGAWFHSRHLWVQNEETFALPNHVDRLSYEAMLAGFQPKPKSPEESLGCMRVRPGFKVELVASEPLVQDPIAFDWGADGKLWVVEMGDYPMGTDGAGKGGGVVRLLEDQDGDGRFDKSTPFLEGINFPTGVMPWRNGILVSAAPEIFYAEDTNGDGKADIRQPLYHGFREGNQQHRLNGFEYGLDNWIYGANGDSGGQVRTVGIPPGLPTPSASRWTREPLELRGRDFRFRPDEGLIAAASGQTQFGRRRDDWGNWFGNNNPTWIWHFVFPEEYLARNPHLAVKSVRQYLANYPNSTRVFPISRTQQRFNDIAMVNHVTSANSPTPCRGELFGPEFATSVFISEPVHNLVHREVLESNGVTFSSRRAKDEEAIEFLASTDNWFRPVMLKTGPDGALYVADMYRLVLEHPEWIPADSQRLLDLRAGADKGRIYRVFPEGAPRPRIPRLAGLPASQLAGYLASPNGWVRDTAQRLLVCAPGDSALPELIKLAGQTSNPKARLHALCTLDGLGKLTPPLLIPALTDPHPAVRRHALRLSEPFLRAPAGPAADLADAVLQRLDDASAAVRFQLAFTLGEWRDARAGRALARLACQDAGLEQMQTAVLSSALPHTATMLESLFESSRPIPDDLVRRLAELAVVLKEDAAVSGLLTRISGPGTVESWQFAALRGCLDGYRAQEQRLANRTTLDPERLETLFARARHTAADSSAPMQLRLAAIPLLGRGSAGSERDLELLPKLLQPQVPAPVQQAALASLRESKETAVADTLLSGWAGFEPGSRAGVLRVLLGRTEWCLRLLEAIEQGRVPAAQLSPSDRQTLLAHSRASVREQAQRLFSIQSDRRELLSRYSLALETDGDKAKGKALFQLNCAPCHRLHNEGVNVGPDLGMVRSKSRRELLAAILEPNQALEIRYAGYTAVTRSGREISGIIVEETAGSVTLRTAGGLDETIVRTELKELAGSGLSLMPEGFEAVMSPAELADLMAFVTGSD